jgi:hypothetical protein
LFCSSGAFIITHYTLPTTPDASRAPTRGARARSRRAR